MVAAVLSGAVKVYAGISYVPLILDAALVFILLINIKNLVIPITFVSVVVVLLFAIGTAQLFNPYLSDYSFKLKGYRLSAFYILAFFLPLAEPITPARLRRRAAHLILAGVLCALIALKQWMLPSATELAYAAQEGVGAKFYGDQYFRPSQAFRVFGSTISSTHMAALMLMFASIAIGHLAYDGRKKVFFLMSITLFLVGVLLTFSRTALLGGIALIAYNGLVLSRTSRSTLQRWTTFFLILAFGGLATGLVESIPLLHARIMTLQSVGEVSAFLSRLDLWSVRLRDILAAPWGYGTGLAGFHETGNYYLIADNQFLKVFIEWGWVAGILFATMTAKVLLGCLSVPRELATGKVWMIAINGAVLALFPLMMTGQILEAYPVNLLFWYLLGLRETLSRGFVIFPEDSKMALPAG